MENKENDWEESVKETDEVPGYIINGQLINNLQTIKSSRCLQLWKKFLSSRISPTPPPSGSLTTLCLKDGATKDKDQELMFSLQKEVSTDPEELLLPG